MNRYVISLLGVFFFGLVSSASATQLSVKGNLDVYGMWSANLMDHDSDVADGDNYMTTQRMRTYFSYIAHENLKAVLGLEIDNIWGSGSAADWGTDGKSNIKIKHAYMDFNLPETKLNVKAGLQYVALPSVFGNPVFDDDAAALVVSAPVNEMFGLTVGYTRGSDNYSNISDTKEYDDDGDWTGDYVNPDQDDLDMAFIATPVTLDGFNITPYFGYAWLGANHNFQDQQGMDTKLDLDLIGDDDATIWILGANAKLTVFDPLTIAADLIYGALDSEDFESKGWYGALAASYKMDMLIATLFSTYGTGLDDEEEDQTQLPTLAEDWKLTPYIGGVRAFNTGYDSFATNPLGVGSDGTGLWTIGLILDKISFVENLSHKVTVAYVEGTGDEDTSLFTEEDSGWEVYVVNQYNIYENLAAINELGYFSASSEGYEDANPDGDDMDDSYFATIGFQYKF